ncbi:hypothetical protein [Thermodesulfovibrio thiophilus]|uniref:hypothetical protein n=1 Tax=Thermodesulfovibrio thiophilus TaxID=340095 RepID=UPI0003FA422F|nr:hypothetical protein [Thermodesulfovibrio thiophilus]
MKFLIKLAIFIFVIFFVEQVFTLNNINFNFSFLLIYLFVIHYFFPEIEQKKIAPSETLPVFFFVLVGLIEDLFQGVIGPGIISKTITGSLLIIVVKQLFFHWTELFKALIIFIFTITDELIYSLIIIYFFNFDMEYISFFKVLLIKGLFNIPFGLILSWKKP